MANDNFTRQIELEDAELFALVTEKGTLVEEGRALSQEAEELAKQHEELTTQLTAKADAVTELKKRIIARTEELSEDLIGEFELPVTTDIQEDKVLFTVVDALAEFKASFEGFEKFKFSQPTAKEAKEEITQ